mmetsp:Transcript_72516/g.225254  ORF Transcript_72516/g.225254 Transcript_72516/m.225254 type:complete len:566 (+) Transcript_72516:57-1754(+)
MGGARGLRPAQSWEVVQGGGGEDEVREVAAAEAAPVEVRKHCGPLSGCVSAPGAGGDCTAAEGPAAGGEAAEASPVPLEEHPESGAGSDPAPGGGDCAAAGGSAADVKAAEEAWGHDDALDGQTLWERAYGPPPRFERPPHSSPRFGVHDPDAARHLQEHGYAVFAEVLSAEEVATATGLFWEFVEQATRGRVLRSEPETWGGEKWPGSDENGLFEMAGIGQSPFMWYVRTRPAVLQAFALIWGLDDPQELVMSFDGCSAFRPPHMDSAWRTKGCWYHVDQSGKTTGSSFACAQGFVSLLDGDESTGGLSVLPGSHLKHDELFRRWPLQPQRDFFILPRNSPLLTGETSLQPRVVRVRAGDMAVWDSRCVHCNVPAWHRFDEAPLDAAMAEAGIAAAGAPLLKLLTSVADACWLRERFAGNLDRGLQRFGVAPEHLSKVARAMGAWARELEADLAAAGPPLPSGQAELSRLVAYVCASPRSRAPPEELEEKRRAALLGATTTHWPERAEVKSFAPSSAVLRTILGLGPGDLRLMGFEGGTAEDLREELDRTWSEVQAGLSERELQ